MDKPKLRQVAERCWLVTFAEHRTARLRQHWDMRAGAWTCDYHWDSYCGDVLVDYGTRASLDEAFIDAWIAIAEPPAPLAWEQLRVADLAAACERADAGDTARALRHLLLERTGLRWSARVGRGRERFCVRLSAPAKRLHKGALAAADRVLLSSIFGVRVGRDGVLVEPHCGRRADAIWRATGIERAANDVARLPLPQP